MKRNYDLELLQQKVLTSIDEIESELDFPSHFYKSFYDGDRQIYQKEFSQIKLFDEKWIRTIESYYPSLATITKRLKSTLRYEEEILPVEKTKKVIPRAIRHLSFHSELIKEVGEQDDVIPSKVLSSMSEIEYGIYENRFIMTLITRLQSFVLERLKIIQDEIDGQRDTHLSYETEFVFSDAEYEMKVDLKQKEKVSKRKANEHNVKILERVQYLHKLITHLNNSDFMQIMKKYKPVSAPILKTQIILKNQDYKNAYLLWLFLDKYYILDYELDTKTVNKRFTTEYQRQIDMSMFMLFQSFYYHDHKDQDGPSEGKASYKIKKAVQRKTVLDDIEIDPFVYEVEPQIPNEYFLEKMRAIFKKDFEIEKQKKPNFTLGLKSAITQNLAITNDLYASFFEIDQDVDVFERLVQDEDPIKELELATRKYKIAKIIREVKEKDYKEIIQLEKKWQQEIFKKQKQAITYENTLVDQRVKDRIEALKKNYNEETEILSKKYFKEKDIQIRLQKEEMNEYTKQLTDKHQVQKTKLREKELSIVKHEKEHIEKQLKQKQAKQKELHHAEVEKLRHQLELKKAKLKEKLKNDLEKEKIRLAKEKERELKKSQDKMIKQDAIDQKTRAKEKEALMKELEETNQLLKG